MKRFRVVNRTRGTVLGEAVDRADTSRTRNEGLLKRSGLAKGEGLWIVPTQAIHMFFMSRLHRWPPRYTGGVDEPRDLALLFGQPEHQIDLGRPALCRRLTACPS